MSEDKDGGPIMPDTEDGKKRIRELEHNMTMVSKKLDGLISDVSEIKKCLLGDPEYRVQGIISEHKEMYENYTGAKWFLSHVKEIFITTIGLLLGLIGMIIKLLSEH